MRPVLAHSAAAVCALLALSCIGAASAAAAEPSVFRVERVVDGDTIALRNGRRVRLVQIDTPEVYFGLECYGREASARAKELLPPGTAVYLLVEPATDRVDDYGRLLRYVVRVADGLNVNLRLVTDGAAAPYFFDGRRGRYAGRIEALALGARREGRGLWKACPHTRYDPYEGVESR
jgi:micrococcal nuclease